MNAFGNTIRAMRKKRGLAQKDLSKMVGFTSQHISLLENGKRMPSDEAIGRFAHLFNMGEGELLSLRNLDKANEWKVKERKELKKQLESKQKSNKVTDISTRRQLNPIVHSSNQLNQPGKRSKVRYELTESVHVLVIANPGESMKDIKVKAVWELTKLISDIFDEKKHTVDSQEGRIMSNAVSRGMETESVREKKVMTQAEVVNEIRDRESKGLSNYHSVVGKNHRKLFKAAKRHFGTWSAAVEASGLVPQTPSKKRLSKRALKKAIFERVKNGESILLKDLPKDIKKAVHDHFGGIKEMFRVWGGELASLSANKN